MERDSFIGFKAIGCFWFFGAAMASLARITLLWRGTVLDRAWALNPQAYATLAPLGKLIGVPFLLLAVALLIAGVGWFRHRFWGWQLAVVILATQVLGDLFNAVTGHLMSGAAGVLIAGALLLYLLRPDVRSAFIHGQREQR